ncbi:hypothetical protein DFH94DRAFT_295845 [Russula ochroleuca]|uniref:Uncharacterized protein n=1 Tax=Russula ochroleuca TaxID=152965 RepID=A0A9P5JWP0_9AGAM|nr:hypothetical protein DFH94DRAFT_295845 [Russula ochroleuca]
MFRRAILVTPIRVSLFPTSKWLHVSPILYKSTTEKAAEVADKVNKSVGRGLASAIETGEQVTEKTKETLGATKDSAVGGAKAGAEKSKEATRATTEKASRMASKAKEGEFRSEDH